MDDDRFLEAARAWIAGDPDPVTRTELQRLVDADDRDEIAERMAGSLEFGTAGLRGIVGAGSNRMNRAVVIRTSRGLADHMLAAPSGPGSLVLGYDGRLSSRDFAEAAVGVFAAAGIPVHYFEGPTPTPLVSYAARVMGAAAAVVITASHNPPEYNGYKVYAPNTAQIVPPVDSEIAAAIDRVGPAREVPIVADALSVPVPVVTRIPGELVDRYFGEVEALRPEDTAPPAVTVVYTPMHGVGRPFVAALLERAGYRDVHVVPEQAEPDGRFPTVNFPNPEEPGALDLAMGLADRTAADLVLANDPDADRLAVCVPTPAGGWRQLTGNEVGVLLADYVLEHGSWGERPLVVNSIVSSPMLAAVAAGYGARFEQTLTGFKWICTAAMDLEEAAGVSFAFGYEEALGYSVGPVVRDKDGVSAVLWFADLAARCRAEGRTVLDRLAGLYEDHGLWVSVQHSIVRPGTEGSEEIAAAMKELFAAPPASVDGRTVVRATDFRKGAADRPRWLPAASLMILELAGDARVLVRPSGTEPKLKIYVDLRGTLRPGEDMEERRAAATAEARAVARAAAALLGLD